MNVAYSRGCACFVSSTIHKFNPCRDPVNPLDEDEQCNGQCPADSCDGRQPDCDVDEDTGVGTCGLSWGRSSTRRPLQCIEPVNQLKWMSHEEACEDQRGGMVVPYVCDSGSELCCTRSGDDEKTVNLGGFGTYHMGVEENEEIMSVA